MDARKIIAEQIGNLVLANAEQASTIDELQKKVDSLTQQLKDLTAAVALGDISQKERL